MTPCDWSAGVVGTFAVNRPAPDASTASVNVPPTSTPSAQPSIVEVTGRESNQRSRCKRQASTGTMGEGSVPALLALAAERARAGYAASSTSPRSSKDSVRCWCDGQYSLATRGWR